MILKSLYYMIQHRSWGNDLFDGSNECRISGPLGRCQTVPNERSVIWRGHKEVCQVFASMILLYLLKHSMNSVYFWSTVCLTTPDEVMNFPGRICFFFKIKFKLFVNIFMVYEMFSCEWTRWRLFSDVPFLYKNFIFTAGFLPGRLRTLFILFYILNTVFPVSWYYKTLL